MGPILQECVDTILEQVRLLRQIASEFSSFASAPTARPAEVKVDDLLREILDPYRSGASDRIRFEVDVPDMLPAAYVDRALTSRAITNVIENALHAMPGEGVLHVAAWYQPDTSGGVGAGHDAGVLRISVSDSGRGMDDEALARAFEPYFSTKASGTGLGLPIAKRNVELSGGAIAISTERNRGTTVELTLPVAKATELTQI